MLLLFVFFTETLTKIAIPVAKYLAPYNVFEDFKIR